MSKHTPGPWHWEADEIKNDPFNRVRYQVTAAGKTITRIYYSSYEGGPTNAEWDARLIAATPDLLEALKRMESAFDWFVGRSAFTQGGPLKGVAHSDRVRKEVYAAHDAVRAAIAKATGKAS